MMKHYMVYLDHPNDKIPVKGYMYCPPDRVCLYAEAIEENLSGFQVYERDYLIFDGSDYIHRWDVVEQRPGEIWYTSNPDNKQEEPFPIYSGEVEEEQVEPLTNDELTECVAELMCQIDMMKLGLED